MTRRPSAHALTIPAAMPLAPGSDNRALDTGLAPLVVGRQTPLPNLPKASDDPFRRPRTPLSQQGARQPSQPKRIESP